LAWLVSAGIGGVLSALFWAKLAPLLNLFKAAGNQRVLQPPPGNLANSHVKLPKVFWLFFSKKNFLLAPITSHA
jgi:hypothetical protein